MMIATPDDLRAWILDAKRDVFTHLLIVWDHHDKAHRPIPLRVHDAVTFRSAITSLVNRAVDLDEIYDLRGDIEDQLRAARAWTVEFRPDPP